MNVIINGESRQVEAKHVQQLVEHLGLDQKLIVIEIDGDIIAREAWETTALQEGMKIEVVHFVGGG